MKYRIYNLYINITLVLNNNKSCIIVTYGLLITLILEYLGLYIISLYNYLLNPLFYLEY